MHMQTQTYVIGNCARDEWSGLAYRTDHRRADCEIQQNTKIISVTVLESLQAGSTMEVVRQSLRLHSIGSKVGDPCGVVMSVRLIHTLHSLVQRRQTRSKHNWVQGNGQARESTSGQRTSPHHLYKMSKYLFDAINRRNGSGLIMAATY